MECSRLIQFAIICNDYVYKRVGQDKSLGQLYEVQN
jgi:hypothetical protein